MTKRLEMKEFKITVLNVPSIVEMQLTGAKITNKEMVITGYTLKDAKKRAGIQ